jgi:hypothetical protein
VLFCAHSAGIKALLFKVRLKLDILLLDEVLGDVWEASKSNDGAEVAHACREVEWNLALPDKTTTSVCDQVGEDVVAYEATKLSECCGNTVVLATNRRRACFRGD